MKNILIKYKAQLISTGILLSIIASVPMINSNSINKNTTKDQIEVETASLFKFEENVQAYNEAVEEIDLAENINDNTEDKISNDNTENHVEPRSKKITSNSEPKKQEAGSTKPEQNNNSSAPITGSKYTVKKGDTLFLIAQRANVSLSHLKQLNKLSSDVIYENQVLNVKGTVSNSSTNTPNRGNYRDEDLYWLSRIIHAEAQGESYQGKVAVGNVIINRVNSGQFPNTIKGVVFDKQHGYTQFSPVIDGTIYNSPGAESIKAATEVLNGARPVGNALYFLNPRKSTNFWITQNRKYMTTIGLHDFYY